MKEKNLSRANEICNILNGFRRKMDAIKNLREIRTAEMKIEFFDKDNSRFSSMDVSISQLGQPTLKFILEREMHRLQGRIIELEAELRTL